MKKKYLYDGPVTSFNKILVDKWSAVTYAVSEAKARSNISYQFKMKYKLLPGSKIELPGKIEIIN